MAVLAIDNGARLSADIGGTFTDIVLDRELRGHRGKVEGRHLGALPDKALDCVLSPEIRSVQQDQAPGSYNLERDATDFRLWKLIRSSARFMRHEH